MFNVQRSSRKNYVVSVIQTCFCNMFKHSLRAIIFASDSVPSLSGHLPGKPQGLLAPAPLAAAPLRLPESKEAAERQL